MCRQTIIARSRYTLLAALVFRLTALQTTLCGASLNVPEQEIHRAFDPAGAGRIENNINEALAALTNIALKEKISRFASVSGADRKLDSFEAEVSIVDGVERYSSVRGRGRTYNHVSEIRGLWSFGEIVTMLRTTRDILDAPVTNREEEKSPDWTVIRFWGTSADHKWFVTVGGRIYWLDFEGTIRISNTTGEIERLTWNSGAGPHGSGVASVLWDVNFSVVSVADIPCIMPSDSIYRVIQTGVGRAAQWNRTQYVAIGRYGSTVNVRFGQ